MAFWIFKCNPKLYRLNERMADPNPIITDLVTRYRNEIAPGDTVFMMRTGRSSRAIVCVMQVVEGPHKVAELESEQAYWHRRDTAVRWRVLCNITRRVEMPVEELKAAEGLKNLSIFHGWQQTTNFPVTESEGLILLSLVERSTTGGALVRS